MQHRPNCASWKLLIGISINETFTSIEYKQVNKASQQNNKQSKANCVIHAVIACREQD